MADRAWYKEEKLHRFTYVCRLAIVAPAGSVGHLGEMADKVDDSRFKYTQWTSASSGPLGDAGFSPSIGSCSAALAGIPPRLVGGRETTGRGRKTPANWGQDEEYLQFTVRSYCTVSVRCDKRVAESIAMPSLVEQRLSYIITWCFVQANHLIIYLPRKLSSYRKNPVFLDLPVSWMIH